MVHFFNGEEMFRFNRLEVLRLFLDHFYLPQQMQRQVLLPMGEVQMTGSLLEIGIGGDDLERP